MDTVTVWYSKDGGAWKRIQVGAHTAVVAWLAEHRVGEVYDDGYGNAYARYSDNPEEIPDER